MKKCVVVINPTSGHGLNEKLASDIEKVITPKSKAVLLLHYGGIPCEMDEIVALCKKYNLKLKKRLIE